MLVEARDNLIELARIGRRSDQCRDQLRPALLPVNDLYASRRIVCGLQLLPQQFAALVETLSARRQPDLVDRFRRGLIDRGAIDRIDQRSQERIPGEDEAGQSNGLKRQISSGACANRRRTPQRRSRIKPPDVAALLHDDASAEEADARDDIGDDLGRSGIAVETHPDIDEGRRADRD